MMQENDRQAWCESREDNQGSPDMPAKLWSKEVGAVGFSSAKSDWETPIDFFEELNQKYKFTLDPCASHDTAKCSKYFTVEDDGLAQSWEGESVFMNPPYGRGIDKWIQKAYDESQKEGTVVVCLIPARTDTKYWHEYCMRAYEIFFVKGRLKFSGMKSACPFPSAVVVFRSEKNFPNIATMTTKGRRHK